MTVTRTAEQYRADAAAHRQEAADSFERCDTDGFLSQWASGISAGVADLAADIAEQDGRYEFSALFDLAGNLVPAKLIDTRYGCAWALLATDDPHSEFVGWFNPSRAQDLERCRRNDARKGYYVGRVLAQARATTAGSGKGLAGALTVHATVRRTDGGFSRDVKIVDNGQ